MSVVAMYAPAVLLVCAFTLTKILATPTPPPTPSPLPETLPEKEYESVLVPTDKVYAYKYAAVVSVGQNEPAPYASKFKIQGRFLLSLDQNEEDATPAYYMKFKDVQHTLYNGNEANESSNYQPLESAAKEFEEPFVASYNYAHRVKSLKMRQNESGWSKNMKKAVAGLMEISLNQVQNIRNRPSFSAREDTVHGSCVVDYSVRNELRGGKRIVHVQKTFSPTTCIDNANLVATDHQKVHCPKFAKDHLVSFAGRAYEFESLNSYDFFVRKITTWEKTSYIPIADKNVGVQHMVVNQTFEFERTYEKTEMKLPDFDTDNSITIHSIVFDTKNLIKSMPSGAALEGMDFIHQAYPSKDLVSKVKDLLAKMVDYLNTNQIEKQHSVLGYDSPSEELLRTLSYMNSSALTDAFNDLNPYTKKGVITRQIFLQTVARVGTAAAWEFSVNVIENVEIDEQTAVDMLRELPHYVINPNEKLATKMELLKHVKSKNSSPVVEQAAILAYSILLRKTYDNFYARDFSDEERIRMNSFIDKQAEDFFSSLMNETTYGKKVLYMMALTNMKSSIVQPYLWKVAGGYYSSPPFENLAESQRYQMAGMWALKEVFAHTNQEQILQVFWPILSNTALPTEMRIFAYEFLVPKNLALDMKLMMRVHWLMQHEKNDHLFNYHYTTLKNIVHTTDPCNQDLADMMKNVLRLTKRRKSATPVLSQSLLNDYYDDKMDYGKAFKIAAVINKDSGIPQVGFIETSSIHHGKKNLGMGVYWNVDGITIENFNSFMNKLRGNIKAESIESEIRDEIVRNLLNQTPGYQDTQRPFHLELWGMYNGYVISVNVLTEKSFTDLFLRNMEKYNLNPTNNLELFQYEMFNHYKMILSTDIGLPAVFYSQAPDLAYLKIDPKIDSTASALILRLQADLKTHSQRLHEMKVYNPFVGVTHSVQRSVTTDTGLPFVADVAVNIETEAVKVILPRMTESEYSTAGLRMKALEQVMIVNDEEGHLKTHCPTCQHRAAIVSGSAFNNEHVSQSIDTGLEFTSATRNCYVDDMPRVENEAWYSMWDDKLNYGNQYSLAGLMLEVARINTFVENFPYVGTCERIFKASPSKEYPASQVEMSWKFVTSSSGNNTSISVRGIVDSISASTNTSQSNLVIVTGFSSDEHEAQVNFKLSRRTQGEKGLNICFDARETFPNHDSHTSLRETNHEMVYAMSSSDNDDCLDDGMRVAVRGKGELLDEQKQHMKELIDSGTCFKSSVIPLEWDPTKRLDWKCLYEAIEGTSLRKYSYNITYKKVSPEFLGNLTALEPSLQNFFEPHVSYKSDHVEPGNMRVNVIFNRKDNHADVTIMNPYFTYILQAFLSDGEEEDIRSIAPFLENTDFDIDMLLAFSSGELRPCIAHSDELITDLNQTIPMDFRDWTLMSGDYSMKTYAIFVRAIDGGKVGVRIYTGSHVVELLAGESNSIVKIDGVLTDYTLFLNRKSLLQDVSLKWKMAHNLLMLDMGTWLKTKVIYTPYNVIVQSPASMGPYIAGLCGHMGSMTYEQAPLIYSST